MNARCLRRAAAVLVLLVGCAALWAQGPAAASSAGGQAAYSSRHYLVQTDLGEQAARQIAQRLEAATSLFNEFLHFDPDQIPAPLRVRIFAAKADYDAYLKRLIAETREDFVFISYSDPARSELVGFTRPLGEFEASGLHYGFIQFLSAYVPSAPLWLAEGIATFLEYSVFDAAAGLYRFRPNYAWLDALKAVLRDPQRRIPVSQLLLMGKSEAQSRIDAFYPTAWGLVHFLKNSPERSYNRVLWEAIAALDPSLALAENSLRVSERAFAWVEPDRLERDFAEFTLGLTTFNDRVRQGVEEYAGGRLLEAEVSFREAIGLREDSCVPYYYLGLILYQKRAYAEAAEQYRRAESLGVEPALVNYALGVNAFAAQQYDEAVQFLQKAKAADPGRYGEKVDTLLGRIEVLR